MKAVISVIQLKRTVKKKAYPFGQSINGFIPPAEDDQTRHKPISVILKDLHKQPHPILSIGRISGSDTLSVQPLILNNIKKASKSEVTHSEAFFASVVFKGASKTSNPIHPSSLECSGNIPLSTTLILNSTPPHIYPPSFSPS